MPQDPYTLSRFTFSFGEILGWHVSKHFWEGITVIVDGLLENIVSVRDPWGLTGPGSGSGTEAGILFDDSLEHWRFGLHQTIFPNQLKVRSQS